MPKLVKAPAVIEYDASDIMPYDDEVVDAQEPATDLREARRAAAPRDNIAPALRPLAVPIATLTPDPDNANGHPEESIEAIMDSLAEFGQVKVIVVRQDNRVVAAGNGTLEAARRLGWTEIAANVMPMTDDEFTAYAIADNATGRKSVWNIGVLDTLISRLKDNGRDVVGFTVDELMAVRAAAKPPAPEAAAGPNLADRFIIPPFSVLDARQGYWQERKRQWLSLGIQSELGRGAPAIHDHEWQAETLGHVQAANTDATRELLSRPNNGLLGKPEQARLHYRKPNATPGGSPLPAATLGKDGRTVRGDGKGRPLAQTFGSGKPGDLAAGFKAKGGTLGAVAPNEKGPNGILSRTGSVAAGRQILATPYGAIGAADDVSRRIAAATPGSRLRSCSTSSANAMQYDGGFEDAAPGQSGTSIFDPVLCELFYRWFTAPGMRVLDPFAGGSVRGIVGAVLGRAYTGIDLRPEQAAANEAQRAAICPDADLRWLVGDARDARELAGDEAYHAMLSCPPYLDLERYSDDPRDLSTMGHDAFIELYNQIISDCCALLTPDAFAMFVVGDVRDRRGDYQNFPGSTIAAFRAAGLSLYNDAVLVTAVGSLPIRVGRQFAGARKLGTTHQRVLIFLKGDAKRAAAACGEVDTTDLETLLSPDGVDWADGPG